MSNLSKKIQKIRESLVERFPNCFCPVRTTKRPLKVGIYDDIRAQLPKINSWLLRKALEDYVAGPSYKAMLLEGAPRYSLQGKIVGSVNAAQATRAKEQMEQLSKETQENWASIIKGIKS